MATLLPSTGAVSINTAIATFKSPRVKMATKNMASAASVLPVATWTKAVVSEGQVEDQAPAARLVPKVGADLHVAAPLACACRYAVLRADRVSGRAEQGAKNRYHPVVRLGCT